MSTSVRPDAPLEFTERFLADNIWNVVYELAEDDTFRWMAPSVTAVLGWDPANWVGRPVSELIHPDDYPLILAARERAMQGVASVRAMRVARADGSYLWMSGQSRVRHDASGVVTSRVAVLRDVDVLVRERHEVERQRARLQNTLDSLLDPHVVLVPVRDDTGAIVDFQHTDANAAALAFGGITREDLIGSSVVEKLPGLRETSLIARLAHAFEAEEPLILDDFEFGRVADANGGPFTDIRAVRVGDELAFTWRDVTDRHRAADELAASKEQYRVLAENASDVVLLVAPDDTITWASPSAHRLMGLSPTDIVGHRGVEFVHPDDLRIIGEALARTHMGEARYDEYRVRRGDGKYLWVSVSSKPVFGPDGRLHGLVAAVRDIDAEVESRRQLEESEELFRLAMDNSAVGMCMVGPDGEFLRVNAAACQMFGRSAQELAGMKWQDVTHPHDVTKDLPSLAALVNDDLQTFRTLKRYVTADGRVIWGDTSVSTVRNDDRSVGYFVAQVIDVTERIASERAHAEREELLRVVLDGSGDGTTRFDSDLRVEFVNRTVVEQSGISAERWIGLTLSDVGLSRGDATEWSGYLRSVIESGEPTSFEYRIERADGPRWYEARVAPEFGPDGRVTHVIATTHDITARRMAEDELRRLATHDPLTGLANRAAILDEITRSLRAGRRSGRATAVLMIDLDRFKAVNDSLGHGVGDELLLAAAGRIEASVRGNDLVGRLGGDEFVVVMRGLDDADEAMQAAWRLVQDFRSPFLAHGGELYATASIGVTISTLTTHADDALREADTAMFTAKNEGRDQVRLFSEDLRSVVTARLTVEGELRHALERGQLVMWYQPEVDLTTGSVTAVEALLRWRRPDGEVYTAGRFIDIAEETGLILDIGDWVLAQVCAQAAAWARSHAEHPFTVRVNVSALQLAEGGLLDALDAALEASGLDPAWLCIEITETALLRETATVRANLAGVRERGIQIALDDFGTGYASLAYLRQYPVDVLKIDRSFVTHVTTREHDRRLVEGIVSLADALGITVTAEGVETPEQAGALRELRCPGAQGFLYSAAVPPEQIERMLDGPYPWT